jgi:putative DNA primase/helicase
MTGSDGAVLVPLSLVVPRDVEWLWPGRIPLGKVTLIVGDPGLGKSWLTQDIATRVSRGAAWTDGGFAPAGHVVILTAEDGLDDTVVPRLRSMGADLERIDALTAIRERGRERPMSLANDIEQLERALADIETGYDRAVRFVVIDPITAYLGKGTDSHVDADVRGVIAPLAQLAERHGCAIVAVMHLNKAPQARALYRPGGSIAFVASARSVLAVTTDPDAADSPRRFLVPLKMNLAPKPPTLAFAIAGVPPRVDWEPEPVQGIDAEAAMRGPSAEEPEHRSERDEAASFLREELADGPRGAQELKAAARNIGIADRTLMRAKHDLGVAAVRRGGLGHAGRWEWELAKGATFALVGHPNVMAALAEVGTLSDADPMLRAAAEVFGATS